MTFHQDIGFQPAPPPNTAGQFNNLVDTIKGIRDIQGQNSLGAAYQSAIDPVTGQIDQAKLANALAASKTPWMVGPGGIQAGQSMEAQGRGTQAQMSAIQQQTTMLNGFLNSFDMSQPVPADQVDKRLQTAIAGGYATPTYYNQWQQMKQHMDPSELADVRPYLQAYKYVGQSAAEQAERTMGPTVGQQAGILNNLNTMVPGGWTDANGAPRQGTFAQFLTEHHVNPSIMFPGVVIDSQGRAVAAPSGGGGAAAGGAGGGSLNGVINPRAVGGGGAATGGAASSGGGTTTATPAPSSSPYGQSTAMQPGVITSAGQRAYEKDQAISEDLSARTSPLVSALSILRAHPTLQTVSNEELTQLQQTAHAFGFPVGNMTNANAYQELAKYLNQYVQGIPDANRSDQAQFNAAAANVHIGQSREAMETLLAKAIGYERQRAAGIDYFNSQYGGDEQAAARDSGLYRIKTRAWRQQQDPVAYSVDQFMETPTGAKALQDYYAGLSHADKERFDASYGAAKKLYPWLSMTPRFTQQQPSPAPAPAATTPPPPATAPQYMTPREMYGG